MSLRRCNSGSADQIATSQNNVASYSNDWRHETSTSRHVFDPGCCYEALSPYTVDSMDDMSRLTHKETVFLISSNVNYLGNRQRLPFWCSYKSLFTCFASGPIHPLHLLSTRSGVSQSARLTAADGQHQDGCSRSLFVRLAYPSSTCQICTCLSKYVTHQSQDNHHRR